MQCYMDGTIIAEDQETDPSNVVEVDFKKPKARRVTGGGRPPADNWLSKMKTGTSFLARPARFDGWALQEFCHGGQNNGAILLILMDQREHMKMEWIDSERFCQQFDLFEITEEPNDEVLRDS